MDTTPSAPQLEPDYPQMTLRAVNAVLRWRWLVIALPILAGGISGTRSLLSSRSYTARSTFMTQGGTRPQASGLAAQVGINLNASSDPTLSPDFYAELVKSRPVLLGVVRAQYRSESGDSVMRPMLLEDFGDEQGAVRSIAGKVSTSINPKTGVVTVATLARSPALAEQVNRELLRQVNEFNLTRRKSRIGSERQFTQARLGEAAVELRDSEDALQDFYSRNRDFEGSADLRFKEQRLSREVSRRQQLYASLAQAFEQAKIDEVRETPVITILEDPLAVPNSRRTIDKLLLSVLLAGFAGLLFAVGRESLRGAEVRQSDELREMRTLSRSFLDEVRHPFAAIKRAMSRTRSV